MIYQLMDGRLWDVDAARFVDQAPEGAEIVPLYADGRPAGEEYLRRTLGHHGNPVGPELLTLDELKAAKLAEINAGCQLMLDRLTANYPAAELLTFDKQETEARALLAAPEAATPLLTPLAAARGMETGELARKVIAKADAFTAASGHIIGQRQKYEDALNSARSVEAVLAIVPEFRLPEAE